MSQVAAPLSLGAQAATLAAGWHDWTTNSIEARRRAAQSMRISRANEARRTELTPSILAVLATRPHLWWAPGDVVAPLAARGWDRTPTQVSKALFRAHVAGQCEKRHRTGERYVSYRALQAPADSGNAAGAPNTTA